VLMRGASQAVGTHGTGKEDPPRNERPRNWKEIEPARHHPVSGSQAKIETH
jgi:hypothetical protein